MRGRTPLASSAVAPIRATTNREERMEPIKTLGTIIGSGETRDAIHIAIAPVVAAERLKPGQHVGFVQSNQEAVGSKGVHIGVIDPFLPAPVAAGERCWMFLYPNTITSLRHEWVHPAFGAVPVQDTRSASEKWMRAWAMENVSYDYYGEQEGSVGEDAAYAFALKAGHDLHIGPYESARDFIDNEWWNHWEIITGQHGQRGEGFSCSC